MAVTYSDLRFVHHVGNLYIVWIVSWFERNIVCGSDTAHPYIQSCPRITSTLLKKPTLIGKVQIYLPVAVGTSTGLTPLHNKYHAVLHFLLTYQNGYRAMLRARRYPNTVNTVARSQLQTVCSNPGLTSTLSAESKRYYFL